MPFPRNFGRAFRRRIKSLYPNTDGSLAIPFALGAVVMMVAIGAAVDMGRWLHARNQTSKAIDAAVLAGAQVYVTSKKDTAAGLEAARKFYEQNVRSRLPVDEDTVNFAINSDGDGIFATGHAYIDTPFLHFAGVDRLPLTNLAESENSGGSGAHFGNRGQSVEVSLILDITGSMAGSKLSDLKAAAKDLVDIVVWDDQSEFYSKVALIPYSQGVNLGSSLATTARGSVKSGTATTPGSQKFTFSNASNGRNTTFSVSNCISERTGSNAYTDASPSTAKVGFNYPASNNPCPDAQIVPLTKDKSRLNDAIDDYKASGSTAGHIGLAWGWYTLSPKWNSVFTGSSAPAAYSKLTEIGPKGLPLLKKIAVLMTDGDFNTAYCNGVISKDAGTGSGSAADHINCNATNGSSTSQALKLCTEMKKSGIVVYTVGFDVGNQAAARSVMQDCATDPTKVYIAGDGEQLRTAFRDIAMNMLALYLSK